MDRLLPKKAKQGSILSALDFPGVEFQIVEIYEDKYHVQNSWSGEIKEYTVIEAQEYFVYQYDLKLNIFIHRPHNANNKHS